MFILVDGKSLEPISILAAGKKYDGIGGKLLWNGLYLLVLQLLL
jgi:hypothetical protein